MLSKLKIKNQKAKLQIKVQNEIAALAVKRPPRNDPPSPFGLWRASPLISLPSIDPSVNKTGFVRGKLGLFLSANSVFV